MGIIIDSNIINNQSRGVNNKALSDVATKQPNQV